MRILMTQWQYLDRDTYTNSRATVIRRVCARRHKQMITIIVIKPNCRIYIKIHTTKNGVRVFRRRR